MLLSIISFIAILAILVLIHELGHFAVAKLCGMRVDEFAFGFPPRLFGRQKGETMYAINAIPLGGYVKLHGEGSEVDDGDPRSFRNKPLLARIAVIIAGVVMNVLLAFTVLTVAFSVGFSSISQDLTQVPGHTVVKNDVYAAEILANSAADKAGLKAGDTLDMLNSTVITSDSQLQATTKALQTSGALDAQLTVIRSGKQLSTPVHLAATGPALGVGLEMQQIIRVPFYRAPLIAAKEVASIVGLTWDALKGFGSKLFVHGKLDPSVSGPIGIYKATASAAHTGIVATVFLLVALSLNLAIMNILPIPALDGGRLVFLVIEGIFRKRVIAEKVENVVNAAGFALIMGLIVVLSIRDVIHF